jgi:type IV pilus assembly protein PilY1
MKISIKQVLIAGMTAIVTLAAHAGKPTDVPLIGSVAGVPMLMINMSKDHQLSYRAYTEYSDLDGDGVLETTYKHSINYYGYFDPTKCYAYESGVFEPKSISKKLSNDGDFPVVYDKYCTGQWSGNFLNWATMTRMDIVRKILYGGKRSTDSQAATVLERHYLPTDAHSFAKYYNGADLGKVTPFTNQNNGITLCNLTLGTGTGNGRSQGNTNAPLMRVAAGNFQLWNSNERWQCYWREEKDTYNAANSADTGLNAATRNPWRDATTGTGAHASDALKVGSDGPDFIVRVKACVPFNLASGEKSFGTEQCDQYPKNNFKPTGILHDYGKNDTMYMGLMTGSFEQYVSGGVLRRNVASFKDEVDFDNWGQFKNFNGIVSNLNALRIFGYGYDDGTYDGKGDGNCTFQIIGLKQTDNKCSSWGNPLSQIYIESLRYFAGKSATAAFTDKVASGRDSLLGMTVDTWTDPLKSNLKGVNSCSRMNVLNFNASVSSYDFTSLTDITSMGATKTAKQVTTEIGVLEGVDKTPKPVGFVGTPNASAQCTPKTVDLGAAGGLCPEAPTQQGSYLIAGAAYWAKTNRIRPDLPDTPPKNTKDVTPLTVNTFGVAMATGTPVIRVPVPGDTTGTKSVLIQPVYLLDANNDGTTLGSGTLVDFRVVYQDVPDGKTIKISKGRFYVNWEDSEQGGDYDQDASGFIEYEFSEDGKSLKVTTLVTGYSSVNAQGFGYIINGVKEDGVKFHSGASSGVKEFKTPSSITTKAVNVYNAAGTLLNGVAGSRIGVDGQCVNCVQSARGGIATTAKYSVTGEAPDTLKNPLWYAAKYGGFKKTDVITAVSKPEAISEWADRNFANLKAKRGRGEIPGNPSDAELAKRVDPDNYFFAANPGELPAALRSAFQAIPDESARASVSVATRRVTTGSRAFIGSFGANWSGDFKASKYEFTPGDVNGDKKTDPGEGYSKFVDDWSAATLLTGNSLSSTRQIISRSGGSGVPFQWGSLGNADQLLLQFLPSSAVNDGLGAKRLEWLRGSETDERTSANPTKPFRARPETKLGDIINSNSWFVAAPRAEYPSAQYPGYGAFAKDNAARKSVVYVGANDGMLHAFDASNGNELLAYVPSTVLPKLPALTDPLYQHRYYVDGSPFVADVKVGTGSAATDWKSILFSPLGAGGQGIFALDVTDPGKFNESNASALSLWEFNDKVDADMGYILGAPTLQSNYEPNQVALMNDGKFYVVFGNGVASEDKDGNVGSGGAFLYLVPVNGPLSDRVKITARNKTSDDTENGLATPTTYDTDFDGKVDVIYAGDLKGNMWKFDVSSKNKSDWKLALGGAPLYMARDAADKVQPITSAPAVVQLTENVGGVMVSFGTGKFYEIADKSSLTQQSAYGVLDNNSPLTTGRADLVEQTLNAPAQNISGAGLSGGTNYRTASANPVCFNKKLTGCGTSAEKRGWFIDFPIDTSTQTASERVVYNTQINEAGELLLTTWIPSGQTCDADGRTWFLTLSAVTGGSSGGALYDVNGDGVINALDVADPGDASKKRIVSGRDEAGLIGSPVVTRPSKKGAGAESGTCQEVYGTAGGKVARTLKQCPAIDTGRLNWREVVR